MEFLCFDINVHVPHHVMSKIPWYNLRAATDSLRQVRPKPGGRCCAAAVCQLGAWHTRSHAAFVLMLNSCLVAPAELGRLHDGVHLQLAHAQGESHALVWWRQQNIQCWPSVPSHARHAVEQGATRTVVQWAAPGCAVGAWHDSVALSRLHPATALCCAPRRHSHASTLPLPCALYIFTHCHVYDPERNYVPFDSAKPETLFEIQRRALPDSM